MDEKTMSFWDHLEVFRGSLVRIVITLLIFMVISFVAMPYIYNPVILGPTHGDFFLYRLLPIFKEGFSCDLININVASQFMTHVTTSFWLALVLAFPVLIWEIWKFISPALYQNESRPVGFAFLFGTGMFYVGCLIGYCIIFPFMFRFLTEYQLSEEITNQINLNSYMHNFLMMIFIMGLMFELPLLIWVLSRLGVIDKSFLRKYRRHAIVILMVLAAIITPSGDPFTLMVTFTPLYLLYELGICLARKPEPAEEYDDDDDDDDEEKPKPKKTTPAPVAPDSSAPLASTPSAPADVEPGPETQETFEGEGPASEPEKLEVETADSSASDAAASETSAESQVPDYESQVPDYESSVPDYEAMRPNYDYYSQAAPAPSPVEEAPTPDAPQTSEPASEPASAPQEPVNTPRAGDDLFSDFFAAEDQADNA